MRVVLTIFAVVAMVAVLRLLERFFAPRDASGARRTTRLFARERLTDVAHIAFNQLVTKRVVTVLVLGVFFVFVIAFGLPRDEAHVLAAWHDDARLTHLPFFVQVPLALVFADFVGYWAHRALHVGRLWRFHAVHHSSRVLDWLAGARNHPIGEAFTSMCVVAAMLVAGFDPRVLTVTAPLGLYAILLHANVRWGTSFMRYVLVTPLVHRWHHAHPDAIPPQHRNHGVNFAGLLPLWDLMFGTFHAPARDPETFGVDETEEAVPQKFFAQLAFPFRRRRVSSL